MDPRQPSNANRQTYVPLVETVTPPRPMHPTQPVQQPQVHQTQPMDWSFGMRAPVPTMLNQAPAPPPPGFALPPPMQLSGFQQALGWLGMMMQNQFASSMMPQQFAPHPSSVPSTSSPVPIPQPPPTLPSTDSSAAPSTSTPHPSPVVIPQPSAVPSTSSPVSIPQPPPTLPSTDPSAAPSTSTPHPSPAVIPQPSAHSTSHRTTASSTPAEPPKSPMSTPRPPASTPHSSPVLIPGTLPSADSTPHPTLAQSILDEPPPKSPVSTLQSAALTPHPSPEPPNSPVPTRQLAQPAEDESESETGPEEGECDTDDDEEDETMMEQTESETQSRSSASEMMNITRGSLENYFRVISTPVPLDHMHSRIDQERETAEESFSLDSGAELITHSDTCPQPTLTAAQLDLRLSQASAADEEAESVESVIDHYLKSLPQESVTEKELLQVKPDMDPVVQTILKAVNGRTKDLMQQVATYRNVICECLRIMAERNREFRWARQKCSCGAFEDAASNLQKSVQTRRKVEKRLAKAGEVQHKKARYSHQIKKSVPKTPAAAPAEDVPENVQDKTAPKKTSRKQTAASVEPGTSSQQATKRKTVAPVSHRISQEVQNTGQPVQEKDNTSATSPEIRPAKKLKKRKQEERTTQFEQNRVMTGTTKESSDEAGSRVQEKDNTSAASPEIRQVKKMKKRKQEEETTQFERNRVTTGTTKESDDEAGTRVTVSAEVHDNEAGHWQCEHCGQVYSTKGNLKKHLQRHEKEPKFRCDVCHKAFKATADVRRHQQVIHTCQHCGRNDLKNKEACRIHVFHCEYNPKNTAARSLVKNHSKPVPQ